MATVGRRYFHNKKRGHDAPVKMCAKCEKHPPLAMRGDGLCESCGFYKDKLKNDAAAR